MQGFIMSDNMEVGTRVHVIADDCQGGLTGKIGTIAGEWRSFVGYPVALDNSDQVHYFFRGELAPLIQLRH